MYIIYIILMIYKTLTHVTSYYLLNVACVVAANL